MTMDSEFSSYTKKQLVEYLKKCNQPTFGNKSELISRARGAKELGLDNNQNTVPTVREKIVSPLGENLPHPSQLKTGWFSDCQWFPDLTEKELYNFLVLSRHRTFDNNPLSARRQLKAKIFYEEGHVSDIKVNPISDKCSHCFVKCNTLPSVPTKDKNKKPAYQTWVCLSKVTGQVYTAECNCVAGEGESCNHIAALLYGIADITTQKYTGKIAPTSKACDWIKPRSRNLSPKKSQDMVFSKFKSPASKTKLYNVKNCQKEDLMSPTVLSFKEKLEKANPNAAWLKNFKQSSSTVSIDTHVYKMPELHNISFCFMDTIDLTSIVCTEQFSNYFDSLSITKEECSIINKLTIGQHSSELWKQSRYGRLTASNYGNIVRRKSDTPPDNLLKYMLGYTSTFTNAAVNWGRNHEKIAIDSYLLKVRESHQPLTVCENGLIVNENLPHLGASPDGLIYCSHCNPYHGVIEVKCPYRLRDLHPLEAAKNENFFCHLDSCGKLRLKRSHAYYYQIQGQLAITKRQWCHFVVWTNKGVEYEQIWFDKELWENVMLPKLNAFFCNALIPELFTDRVKRGLKLYN